MALPTNEFPYSNLHDLNLDWLLRTLKELQERVSVLEARVAALEAEE